MPAIHVGSLGLAYARETRTVKIAVISGEMSFFEEITDSAKMIAALLDDGPVKTVARSYAATYRASRHIDRHINRINSNWCLRLTFGLTTSRVRERYHGTTVLTLSRVYIRRE